MLEFLRIRDIALIENIELTFAPGLNVLTGETGAGKSFILKALGFLLGDKLQADMVRQGADKAQVEAIFIVKDEEICMRRELTAETGRSRLFINDTLGSQEILKNLRAQLIVHTSQHGQQRLLQPAWQAKLLDNCLQEQNLLQERDTLLKELHDISAERQKLKEKYNHLADRRDLLEMQQHEIDKVSPQPGEEDMLESLRHEARTYSARKAVCERGLQILHGDDGLGLIQMLGSMEHVLQEMCKDDDTFTADYESICAVRQSLPHLERHFRCPPQNTDIDLDALESRLYALAQLKRKLHRSLDDIVRLRQEIDENLSFLDMCNLDITRLANAEARLCQQLQAVLAKLLPARRNTAEVFSAAMQRELTGLGFSENMRVLIDFMPVHIWQDIHDERGRILWAPNPGQTPQPLDKIASGGELSRFLLALVGVRPVEESATYIFDEVDAGVGGITLNRVGERLQKLADARQMLLITHWPQLAAHAARHFTVNKIERDGMTFVSCRHLNAAERTEELARMAGGGEQGNALAAALL